MSIENKLLKYKQEIDDIEKEVQRSEGSLDNMYDSLKKDLNIEGKPDKLIKETKKMVKKIDNQAKENDIKLENIIEKIETEYQKLEGE